MTDNQGDDVTEPTRDEYPRAIGRRDGALRDIGITLGTGSEFLDDDAAPEHVYDALFAADQRRVVLAGGNAGPGGAR